MKNIKINNILRYYAFIIFILFFTLLPFGQLLRIEKNIFNFYVVIHPIDIIAILSLPYLFIVKRTGLLKYVENFILIIIASFIFSLTIFEYSEIFRGSFYLFRLVSYFALANLTYYLSHRLNSSKILLKIIQTSIFIFMIFGLYQFFYFYDLRDLYYVGWDDHYYRLTSTFFDPGFSASILIVGLFIFIRNRLIKNNWLNISVILLFLVSIFLTFSRAGYLALLIVTIINFKNYINKILIAFILLLTIILIIPKPQSSGVELYRLFSIKSRLINYSDTLEIFKKYPLFGIGFNNLCIYKTNYLLSDNIYSHSCSGSDSSLFLLLATTGVVGIITFINSAYLFNKYLKNDIYGNLLKISFLTILIGSFFNNNLFYNFLMGIIAVFIGLSNSIVIPDS